MVVNLFHFVAERAASNRLCSQFVETILELESVIMKLNMEHN
jgi:hypothetical protein